MATVSHEVGYATKSCEKQGMRSIGLPHPAVALSFPNHLHGIPTASGLPVFTPGSSFRALRLLFRAFTEPTRPLLLNAGHLPWASVPHRGINRVRPPHAGIPSLLRSALDVSRVLDGFLRTLPRGSISPHNHVQGSLLRGFPSQTAARARHPIVPSCRYPLCL